MAAHAASRAAKGPAWSPRLAEARYDWAMSGLRRSVLVGCVFVASTSCSAREQQNALPATSTALSAIRRVPVFARDLAVARKPYVFEQGFRSEKSGDARAVDVDIPNTLTAPTRIAVAGRSEFFVELLSLDVAPSPGVIEGSAVVHANARIDTDVVELTTAHRYEELRVLWSSRAPRTARYRMRMGNGVADVRLRDGRIELLDAHGYSALASNPMYAIDADGKKLSVAVKLETNGDDRVIVVALEGEGRYPITVDPGWTTAPDIKTRRRDHNAPRLNDGRVLLAGGGSCIGSFTCESWSTTEIYDPATNTWSDGATMPGGYRDGNTSGQLVTQKDGNVFGAYPYSVTYNATAKTWTLEAASGLTGLVLTTALDDGRVLVQSTTAAKLWNPTTKMWSTAAAPIKPQSTAVKLASGKVLSFGDATWTEIYDPVTDMRDLAPGHGAGSGVLLSNGQVLAISNPFGTPFVNVFDPTSKTWTAAAGSLAAAREFPAMATLTGGKTIVVGGITGTATMETPELFDPISKTFSSTAPALEVRSAGASVTPLLNGGALAIGGESIDGKQVDLFKSLPLASACATGADCATGFCVDAVCCSASACGGGAKCNNPGKAGTCTKNNGTTCAGATECASGSCIDGVCCNTTCTDQCAACDVIGKLGTCSAVSGAPHGARTSCSAGTDTCSAKTCNGTITTACQFVGTSILCGMDTCKETATGSGSYGETRKGTCNGSGVCTATSNSCTAYACNSTNTACASSCSLPTDCAAGYKCVAGKCETLPGLGAPCTVPGDCATGTFCVDKVCCGKSSCGDAKDWSCAIVAGTCTKRLGAPCGDGAECGSAKCVDGVCCDTACSGQCEACDIIDPTTERKGVCTPVKGAPHGTRMACAKDSGNVCADALCDGADRMACKGFVGTGTPCREPKCTDALATPGQQCDGKGTCPASESIGCGGYACTADGKECRTSCSAEVGCAPEFLCRDGKCEKVTAKCSDDKLSSTGADGLVKNCAPYKCGTGGVCEQACATSADCVGGTTCDITTKLCVAPPAAGDDGGCALGHASSSSIASAICALAALGLARRRHRRKLCAQTDC
jgi:hypothetical protein